MTAMLTCWMAGVILLGGQVAGAPSNPWVEVQDARGRNVLAFATEDKPFESGVLPRGGESRVVRDARGRTITGFAYYGWMSGSNVHVVVLAEVPSGQAREGSFASDDPGMRYEQVARYALSVGESRRVAELKAFGAEPTTVRIAPRR